VEILIEYKTTFKQDRIKVNTALDGEVFIMKLYRDGVFSSPANSGVFVPVEYIKFSKIVATKEEKGV
jgi:hypothetical protein